MDKNLFFYELEGRGYTFENMTWLGNCFEDDLLNMAWEMWSSAKHSVKARAVPEYAEFYLGGGVFAICDWKDYETVKNFKWNTSSRQSRTQWVWAHDPKNADINRRKVAMHNLIMCPPEGLYVDHINGNGLDNRRSNLRIVTKQQNTFNSAHKGGTSKYKGVCLEKESGMWKAYITKDGKKKSIGRFALEDDAARAYDKEAISLFREHAKLNFLPKAMIEAQEPAPLKLGDLVKPIDHRYTLASGCERYPYAYVVNTNPFQLMSEEGDMYWRCTVEAGGYKLIKSNDQLPEAVSLRMIREGLLSPVEAQEQSHD